MASLALEAHLLRLLENERHVRAFLEHTAPVWSTRLDLTGGELLFLEQGTGRVLLSSPVKLIGTEDRSARTFLFSWADPEFHEDWGAMSGLGRLRVAARDAGLAAFDELVAFPLDSASQAQVWTLLAAGFLESGFAFEVAEGTRVRYLAVQELPRRSAAGREVPATIELVAAARARFSFGHRAAIEAYLGKPQGAGATTLTQETLFWSFGQDQLRAIFDHQGQLMDLVHDAPPAPEPVPEPEPTTEVAQKPGLLTRWFGKRR